MVLIRSHLLFIFRGLINVIRVFCEYSFFDVRCWVVFMQLRMDLGLYSDGGKGREFSVANLTLIN